MSNEQHYKRIKPEAREEIIAYICLGRPIGGFLEAVLSNDLCKSFGRADEHNLSIMFSWALLMHNVVPMAAQSSKQAISSWSSARQYDPLRLSMIKWPACWSHDIQGMELMITNAVEKSLESESNQ